MEVGTRLREARLRQGMTLRDVAATTKLPTRTLEQIENNELDRLPRGIFTRGHLRAYASAVGLGPDEVVSDYLAQCPAAHEELPFVRPPPVEHAGHPGRVVLAEIVTLVIAAAVYASFRAASRFDTRLEAPPDQVVGTSATSETPEVAEASPRPERAPGLQLEIQARGECWVSATADGQRVVYRLLQSGDRTIATARGELVLRIGDPETFVYRLNGAPGRPLGQAGKPVTIHITADNYRTFVGESAPTRARDQRPGVT